MQRFHNYMQYIAGFYSKTITENLKVTKQELLLSIIISIFAVCSPFVGLVEKISGVVSLAPDIFLFIFELFPENIWQFQRNTLYLQHPTKLQKMTTTLLKKLFLHAMVWKAETPQCFSVRHRTPKACLFSIPKIYSYDCKNQFGR